MSEPTSPGLPPYTLVVTSCGRFDLLEATLRSFYKHIDVAPQELIVVEDSADEQVRDVVDSFGVPARTLVNGDRLGQMRAIDPAAGQVGPPPIVHCQVDAQV